MGPCEFGKEDPITGSCAYLMFDEDIASCPKIKAGYYNVIKTLRVGQGCSIRSPSNEKLIDEFIKTRIYRAIG